MAIEKFLEDNSDLILDHFYVSTSFGPQMFYIDKKEGILDFQSYIKAGGDLGLRPYRLKEQDFYKLKQELCFMEEV